MQFKFPLLLAAAYNCRGARLGVFPYPIAGQVDIVIPEVATAGHDIAPHAVPYGQLMQDAVASAVQGVIDEEQKLKAKREAELAAAGTAAAAAARARGIAEGGLAAAVAGAANSKEAFAMLVGQAASVQINTFSAGAALLFAIGAVNYSAVELIEGLTRAYSFVFTVWWLLAVYCTTVASEPTWNVMPSKLLVPAAALAASPLLIKSSSRPAGARIPVYAAMVAAAWLLSRTPSVFATSIWLGYLPALAPFVGGWIWSNFGRDLFPGAATLQYSQALVSTVGLLCCASPWIAAFDSWNGVALFTPVLAVPSVVDSATIAAGYLLAIILLFASAAMQGFRIHQRKDAAPLQLPV